MTIFIGTMGVATRYLPVLEHICDEHGGSILMTEKGISYELPARLEAEEPQLRLVLGSVSMEMQEVALQKAA